MGLLALIGTNKFASASMKFVTAGVRTQATVTELSTRATEPGEQYPVISYTDKAGNHHTVPRSSANYPAKAKLGASFPIRYLKANPDDCRFDNFKTLWRTATKGALICAVNFIVGFVLLFRR